MASDPRTVAYVLAQIAAAGAISAKKMFGEYGLYCSGKFFGLICDDRLYLKPTPGGRALLGDAAAHGTPYPGAKPHLQLSGETWDDADRLAALVRITVAELPVPPASTPSRKPRRPGRRRNTA